MKRLITCANINPKSEVFENFNVVSNVLTVESLELLDACFFQNFAYIFFQLLAKYSFASVLLISISIADELNHQHCCIKMIADEFNDDLFSEAILQSITMS